MKNRVRVSHVFVWQTVFIFCRIAHSLARPMGGVCASPELALQLRNRSEASVVRPFPHTPQASDTSVSSQDGHHHRAAALRRVRAASRSPSSARGVPALRADWPRVPIIDRVLPPSHAWTAVPRAHPSWRATGMTALNAPAVASASWRSSTAPSARYTPFPRQRD